MWLKRTAAVAGVVLLLWALAWAAVPPLLKWQAQARLSELLGRSVALGDVSFQPWRLELTLNDIVVGAASGPESPLPARALPASGAAAPSVPAASAAEPLLRKSRHAYPRRLDLIDKFTRHPDQPRASTVGNTGCSSSNDATYVLMLAGRPSTQETCHVQDVVLQRIRVSASP